MKQDGILEFFDGANSPSTTPKGSCLSKKDEDAEVSTQSLYVVRDGFFVKTDEKWEKVRYDEILWVRAFENGSVMFLTNERSLMVNHRLWRIEEMLTEHPNFVRTTGRRLSIWISLMALRVIATISARIRCMQREFTANGWKVYSLRRSSSDYTPCA